MTQLSVSEARAEAVALVLQVMLRRLDRQEFRRTEAAALRAAKDLGAASVMEELVWLLQRRD